MAFSTKSVDFNGVDGYVVIDTPVFSKERTDAFSISCWAKTKASSAINTLVGKMDSSSGTGYLMFLNASGQFEVILRNTAVTNSLRVRTDIGRYNEGGYHHFVMTYDGAGSILLYVDGIVKATTTVYNNLTSSILNVAHLQIGAYDGPNSPFEGNIDDVSFHNAELTASEVLDVFGSASPVDIANLGKYSPLTTSIYINQDPVNQNEGVTFPSPLTMPLTGQAFTMGCWAKKTLTIERTLMTKCRTGAGDVSWMIRVDSHATNRIYVWYNSGGGTSSLLGFSGATITLNDWHHVVFVHDGVNVANSKVYVDGVPFGLSSGGSGSIAIAAADGQLGVGGIWQAVGPSFGNVWYQSNVCHSFLYDKVLSQAEVTAIYGGGVPQDLSTVGPTANLKHWCALGDGDAIGSGNFVDLSGGGNHGTAQNFDGPEFVLDVPEKAPNIIGLWKMGDGDTYPIIIDHAASEYQFPIVRDMSGNDFNGTATNMEAADAVRDIPRSDFCKYSTVFDGSADYYTMGNVFDFEYTEAFSASCWFKTEETGAGWFMAKMSSTGPSRGWGFGINSGTGDLKLELTNAWSSNVNFVTTVATGFNDNEWHHCVVTWDGNASPGAAGMHIYVDGVDQPLNIVHNSLSATMVTTIDLRIGTRTSDHPAQAFDGKLIEASVYYKELSPSEVVWIYNGGLPQALDGYGAPPNLVAWWRLGTIEQVDEQVRDLVWGASADTSQINDMSRYTNHATPTNTEVGDFTSDTPGGDSRFSVDLNDHLYSHESIEFAGASEYITMGDILGFERTDTFSISCWIKSTMTAAGYFVSKQDATPTGYGLNFVAGGKIRFDLRASGLLEDEIDTNLTFNDGQWHHVVATNAGTGIAGMKIYVDGSLAATTVVSNTLGANSILTSANFNIGGRTDGSVLFNGHLDEVAIYDKELSLGEITAIYNSGDPTDLSLLLTAQDLVGWWRLGDGDVYPTVYGQIDSPFAYPTVPDMSVNDNNGTMVNMEVGDSVPEFHRSAFTKYSVDFDGVAEYVTMGDVFGFEYNEPFSASAWVKTTATGGYIISKVTDIPYRGWGLALDGSSLFVVYITNQVANQIAVKTDSSYSDGSWHHVCFSYNGSGLASGVVIYVDGVAVATTVSSDTLASNTILNSTGLNLAARENGGGAFFDGKIADAAIYDTELSAADVTWMYNGGTPLDLRDGYDDGSGYNDGYLAAYWRPGNGRDELGYIKKIQDWVWGDSATKETTTITDASWLANDLTLNNMVAADVVTDTPGGISNYSCRFDGVDSFAFTSLNKSHYAIENGDVLSLSGWVKTTSSGDPEYLWGNAYSGTGKAGYHVSLSSGKPTFSMIANDLSAIKFIIQTTSATVNDGYWHHIVFTEYNVGTNNYNVVCYIDGVSVGLTTLNNALASSSISTGEGFSIGGRGSAGDDPLDGYIDEVSVYTKSLTQSDVTAIYNGGAPVDLRDLPTNLHMKGWWRMGDSYGIAGTAVNTEALDKVGDAPGAIVFTTRSLQFNPANEYVNLGNPSELNFDVDDPFSISAWVKQSQPSSYQGVVGKSTGGVGWYLTVYNSNISADVKSVLQFVLDGTGLIEVYMGDRRGAFPYNEWVHVVVTYDGSNSAAGVKFYMNGELYVTQVRYDIANATIVSSANVLINYANDQDGIGNLDEVSIWNKELTQADVTKIWNGGDANDLDLHPSTSNLAGWWRLGDGYGPVSGTMTNMSADDINGDIPVASPEYLITASGTTQADFGATSGPKWTAAAWIKTTASFGVIINKNYSTDFSGWGMRLRSGYPTLWWASNPASLITEQRSDVQINDGYWHHVVALREKAPTDGTPICKFYVDGVLTGTTTIVDTNVDNTINNSGTVSIGFAKGSGEGEQPFIGKIAEVAVWQRHLTYAQILDAYNAGSPPNLVSLDSESALVGWWKCGDDSGYPGTPVSILTSAKQGDVPEEEFTTRSFGMDGSDEYVDAGNVLGFERTDAFSLSIWFKTTGTPGNFALLTKRNNSGNVGYAFQITANAELHAVIRNTFSTNEAKVTTNAGVPYNDGQWHHAVMCYDGSSSASGITIYVDGVSRSYVVNADTLSASILTSTSFRIGAKEAADYFPGNLDEASVWSKELSQAEVTELYNDGTPANLTEHSAVLDLEGWWRMGEEAGSDGTMINMVPGDIILNAPREAGAVGEKITYFLMRGIDSACGTLTYHHWLVTEFPDFTGAQAGTLPCGGPLTDIVVASSWSVIN